MSASGPEPALQPSCVAAPQRRPRHREGRAWFTLRSVLVALQVVWWTLIGWIGATLTLLPLAVRGAPAGRKVWVRRPRVVRLLDPRLSEVLPR